MSIEHEDSLSNEAPTENVQNTDSTQTEIISSEEKQSPFRDFVVKCAERLDKKVDSVIDKMDDPERTLYTLSGLSRGVGYAVNLAFIAGSVPLGKEHGPAATVATILGGSAASIPFHSLSFYFNRKMENLGISSEEGDYEG